MKQITRMRTVLRGLGLGLGALALVAVGVFLVASGMLPLGSPTASTVQTLPGAVSAQSMTEAESTITLRPATSGVGLISAAGNLELATEHQVVIQTTGIVSEVVVKVGDGVAAGDLLAVLDSRSAEEAVEQALLNFIAAQTTYNDELAGGSALEVAAAAANLRAAQETLADVLAGPSQAELASARAGLAAAQAAYSDLVAGPTAAELTQLAADLRKAEVALQEAQSNYNAVAWRNDVGMTSQAAALQSATIDFERAQAAYTQTTADPTDGELQSALSQIQNAQTTLDDLLSQPTAAAIASAEAQVASAQQQLDLLQAGGNTSALETARIQLAQAQLNLDSAVKDLANTEVRAPAAGTILAVNLTLGQQVGTGTIALTLADTANLELTVNVAEVDIEQVEMGMPAIIRLDALPGQSFTGQVIRVAPASDAQQSVVNYPVTIQLTDPNLGKVRAGMTAVATLENTTTSAGWLAPLTAVQEVGGQAQIVVVRNGQMLTVPVTTGSIQGEWVVVESPQLQSGDAVVGNVATYLTQDSGLPMPSGGGMPIPPGAGGAMRRSGGN